ncbi:hypothetical protein SAY87_021952 [Trapa incisa]|uniref:Uncharacterized protein n=1 Tax=Trapa incisa TaxID=236973 RepID=A0AAN7PSQ4_9MYRT|nr:hypothetical protein SAY87_021952 [Trapa incisa]
MPEGGEIRKTMAKRRATKKRCNVLVRHVGYDHIHQPIRERLRGQFLQRSLILLLSGTSYAEEEGIPPHKKWPELPPRQSLSGIKAAAASSKPAAVAETISSTAA